MPMSDRPADEVQRLRDTLRDLVALSTLPAIWTGYDPAGVVGSFAGVLRDTLALDLVYIRVRGCGCGDVEVACGEGFVADPGRLRVVADALAPVLASDSPVDLADPLGGGAFRAAVTRFGHVGDLGVVVACSRRADFPNESDRLLLGVGANQTAVVLQRKRAEAALREREERLRQMVNVDGVGVLVWAVPAGRLVGSNDYFLRMFGYTRAEVAAGALTWRDMTPPEYVAVSEAQMAGFAQTGRIGPYEKEYLRKDGSRAWMVFAGAALGDGEVVEYCIDISDRKRAEAALREADRQKDDFIALLAHELRNPLAPIRNGLQLLRLGGANPAATLRTQDMMDRQLNHMVRLVDDLLDVSRVNRGKMDLRRERVALADVVASAVETARPALDAAGHELTLSLPATPVVLDADLTRLAQVFSNLLTNSAKYTPKGGRVWLSAERGAGRVRVTVRDTGIGIPAESLPTIFDMFSQVDRSVEKTTGGLGIGLALVKGLVEMHGGTVAAASAGEGRGTTFTVSLPEAGRVEPSAPVTSAASPRGPARRILVVDDNRDGAESLSQVLEMLGHQVETAYDGVEAVERAETFRPPVILMDVGMPRLNGYEATRRIRGHDWGAGVTIIALTGWGQDGDRRLSQEAGCNGHLVKPVSLSDLERKLGEANGTT